jgi:DNA-binding MarR family transcriptional regulator
VTTLTDRDYRSLAGFRHALRVFLRFSEDAARAAGLTPNQHQLLLAIRGNPAGGPPTIADVAELLQLQHHSTVELVDRAVAAGLVVRRADADDGRRQRLDVTRHGLTLLEHLSAAHRDELRRFRATMHDLLAELG